MSEAELGLIRSRLAAGLPHKQVGYSGTRPLAPRAVRAQDECMEVLVVVQDPAEYRAAIDAWRRTATVVRELPPWVALAEPRGEVPDVPGTRWYTGAVPPDVLLTLAPAARLFIAAWRDWQAPKERHGEGLSRDAPGHLPPDRPADRDA
ncbi:MAG TPA: hypothetical protein VGQ92_28270 [Actinoplanes sp.]|jgi:hypothetical protein|nr:hypothetical protein [Actinoplanes sp.]